MVYVSTLVRRSALVLTLAVFSCNAMNTIVPIGLGGYSITLPSGQKGPSDQNGNRVIPKVVSNFSQPIATHDWWSSMLWQNSPTNPYSSTMYALPLSFQARATGLNVGYATNVAVNNETLISTGYKAQEFHYNFNNEVTIGLSGLNSPDTRVADYSDWTVTAQWASGNSVLRATMGHGLPFVYCTKTGTAPLTLTFNTRPNVWYNQQGVLGVTLNGHHYGIFAPNGSAWNNDGNLVWNSTLNGKDYFSLAVLPDNTPATLEFYRRHAYAFITNTVVAWNYDAAHSVLTTTFTATTTLKESGNNNINRALLALFRHQWLVTGDPLTPYTYVSPRGTMKVIDSNAFSTQLEWNGVIPNLPLVAQEGQQGYTRNQIFQYVNTIFTQSYKDRWQGDPPDTYWSGKVMGRMANLLYIADQIGHTQARDLFLQELKGKLQDWFDARASRMFYYDSTWRTLIGYAASYGSNTELNDHHFHYGYFIIAAAAVAQFDPTWAQSSQWGGMVEMLIKDAANWDRSDMRFPFLRHMDPYAGHSWANGSASFNAGNNQESSSEAMNFATGVFLWGTNTGNQAIRDLGIFLYAQEAKTIEQYWFDIDNTVFPSNFLKPAAGIVWGNGGAYAIWWAGPIQEVHGINFLPITAGSLYLGRNPDYLAMNQTYMYDAANGGQVKPLDWIDIHAAVMAMYNPAQALSMLNAQPNYSPEAGDSKAQTYYWLYNMQTLGRVDTSVTANAPTAMAFNKNGQRTYVAYNPTASPLRVLFSDGKSFTVAPKKIATGDSTVIPPVDDFSSAVKDLGSGTIHITFTPLVTVSNVSVSYKINTGTVVNMPPVSCNNPCSFNITGLRNNDKVTYFFTYIANGAAKTSATAIYTYAGTPIPTRPYTVTIESPTATSRTFVLAPVDPTSFADIHYRINSDGQRNLRMTKIGTKWTYTINNLSSGDTISYAFTFDPNGRGYDTLWDRLTL